MPLEEFLDKDAGLNEQAILAAGPAVVTGIIAGCREAKVLTSPYFNSIAIMVALNLAGFYFQRNARYDRKAMQTRLVVDMAAVAASVALCGQYYPLIGPPEPKDFNSALYTFMAISSIMATVRAFLWTSVIGHDLIDSM